MIIPPPTDIDRQVYSSYDEYVKAVELAEERRIRQIFDKLNAEDEKKRKEQEYLRENKHFHNFGINRMCSCGVTERNYYINIRKPSEICSDKLSM